jgi:hypothetical protein
MHGWKKGSHSLSPFFTSLHDPLKPARPTNLTDDLDLGIGPAQNKNL